MTTPTPLNSQFLFHLTGELGPSQRFGAKILAPFLGGSVAGPRIEGSVLPGGGDWLSVRPEGISELDVRITIRTADGALILMSGAGRRVMDPMLAETLIAFEDWAALDPATYYLRLVPTFETEDPICAWLNGIVSVGIGRFTSQGVAFDVHEVL